MARMPQIPQPEISKRPDGQVGEARLPSGKETEEALQTGAETVGAISKNVDELESTRQTALTKMQTMVDAVTATRMAGDHSERLRNLMTDLSKQYIDNPEKLPDEFRKQSQEITNSELAAAPNSQVQLDIAQRYAHIDDQQLAAAHNWSQGRMVQKAKSDFTEMLNGQVRTAQSTATLGGLMVAIDTAKKDMRPHAENLHSDPDMSMEKMAHDMAAGWVEANSPTNPAGVALALGKKDGPLVEHLSPKEIASYARRAESDLKGFGEIQRFQVIKEAIAHGSQAADAFFRGDLDSKNVFQMKRALEVKTDAIEKNPNLTDEEKEHQKGIVDTEMKTLRYLDEAARKAGRFDPNFDQEKQSKLFDDFFKLGKATDAKPKDLTKIVQLRHDLAEAQANRWISDSRAQTMSKALTQMTGKSIDREAKNTGWGMSFMGLGGRSPQQAGNLALNSYFKDGSFGKLTDDQKNQARVEYINQLNDAAENGRNVDLKSTQKMAFDAINYVAGRAHKGKGQ